VWRMCSSNSLSAKWMGEHYLHGLHLSQVEATIYDSGTWKWICSLRSITLENMERVIGNGHTTLLLYDRWVPDSFLISHLPETDMPSEMHKWTVSDIVSNGNWFMRDQDLLPIWDCICSQRVPCSAAHGSGNVPVLVTSALKQPGT